MLPGCWPEAGVPQGLRTPGGPPRDQGSWFPVSWDPAILYSWAAKSPLRKERAGRCGHCGFAFDTCAGSTKRPSAPRYREFLLGRKLYFPITLYLGLRALP